MLVFPPSDNCSILCSLVSSSHNTKLINKKQGSKERTRSYRCFHMQRIATEDHHPFFFFDLEESST